MVYILPGKIGKGMDMITFWLLTETSIDTLYRKLMEAGKTPQGMVYVDGLLG